MQALEKRFLFLWKQWRNNLKSAARNILHNTKTTRKALKIYRGDYYSLHTYARKLNSILGSFGSSLPGFDGSPICFPSVGAWKQRPAGLSFKIEHCKFADQNWYKCHGAFGLLVEDCLKGCIKLCPKSTIPNILSILVSIPKMNWQHKSKLYKLITLSETLSIKF